MMISVPDETGHHFAELSNDLAAEPDTNNKLTANNDCFVSPPQLKWVLDVIFRLQRPKIIYLKFAIAATPIKNDPIQWRAGAASVTSAISMFFALLAAQSQPQLDWCLIDPPVLVSWLTFKS